MRARGESSGKGESVCKGVWWTERERVCVCVWRNARYENEIEARRDESDGRGSDEYETMVGKANPCIERLATSI